MAVTTSLLLWLLDGDQESCSEVLAERWGALRSRVSTLAGEVGWSDSLSHRLYLLNKAMDMVTSDGGEKGGGPGAAATGAAAAGVLPRAGEMMAGLVRQSQTLAVYIGLEDAPDGSGELRGVTPYHRRPRKAVRMCCDVMGCDGM